MNQGTHRTIAVIALTFALALTGCVDLIEEQLDTASAGAGTNGTVAVSITVENAPEDFAHLGAVLKGVYVHDANLTPPDGYYPLELQSGHTDLIVDGQGKTVDVATGEVPAGSYDQIVLQVRSLENHPTMADGNATDGHDHDHDDNASDDHDHSGGEAAAPTAKPFDLPINATFEVAEGGEVGLEIVLDGAASTEDGFQPVISRITVTQDGEVTGELTDVEVGFRSSTGGQPVGTEPPVARATVFGPDGAKVYEPQFIAEDGDFVNSKSSAFALGDELRFSATASETVAKGATIQTYSWDFDDGTTATGANVAHNWSQPGVWEVELTVEDSFGVTDTHLVRVVYLATDWTAELVNQTFEEGAEGWEATDNGAGTSWELDGASSSWHVGHHTAHTLGTPVQGLFPGYTAGAEATLTSPPILIPANWSNAGYKLSLAGASESGFDQLTVGWTAGDQSGQVGTFDGNSGWEVQEDLSALASAAGNEVVFTFTFTSDGFVEEGDGWYMDDFIIGGVDLELHKGHLLEEGGHDGHDHSH